MSNKSYSAVVVVIIFLIAVLGVGILILNEMLGWPFANESDRDSNLGNRDSGIMEPYYSKKKRY